MTSPPAPAPVSRPSLRGAVREPMFATALSLMTNTLLTNALGVLFWVIAARLYDPTAVGRDSALVSLMMALSTIGQLDLANVVVRFLPGVTAHRDRLVVMSYAVAVVLSALLALVLLVAAPHVTSSLRFLYGDHRLAGALIGATALWSIFAIQDGVLTALGGARWVPVENAVYGVLKLAVLFALEAAGVVHGTFLAFAIPMSVLLLPVNLLLFRRIIPAAPPPTEDAAASWRSSRRTTPAPCWSRRA